MEVLNIASHLDDRYPITLDEFCALLRVPTEVVLTWFNLGIGPRWVPFNGSGRLYVTAVEARQFVQSAQFITLWESSS